ncbi:MAG: DUF4215 domain-containing protein, partial [Myxococcales bacterium]|nr:DUF4215 domain-containing protein [Polyangiaceae bacterium]MDW8250195.1 DUF4215 domain-containing protein [Myxococcales bacterium]
QKAFGLCLCAILSWAMLPRAASAQVCGNGAIEAPETCDDGGASNGDGCSNSCDVEPGFVCRGVPSSCAIRCGDGVLAPTEQCDDGNTAAGDGCSSCKFDEKCAAPEQPDSTAASPQKAPEGCSTMNFFPASLSPGSDNDWYCIQATAGQVITAQTYTGSPGFCSKEPNNTLVEIYKGIPTNPGSTQFGCPQSNALACNDDFNGLNSCSRAVYTVPSNGEGEYCARVVKGPASTVGNNNPIPEYGLLLSTK